MGGLTASWTEGQTAVILWRRLDMSGFRQLRGLFLIVGGFTLMGCWVEFIFLFVCCLFGDNDILFIN